MLAGIAQQQRSGVNELGGRRLSAVREGFQPAAFFFGEGNLISGCHTPIIRQQVRAVNIRNVTCYIVLAKHLATAQLTCSSLKAKRVSPLCLDTARPWTYSSTGLTV